MSIASSNCRIDWRPSRLLCAALATLGVLSALSVALSDLPLAGKPLLAALALAYGLWLARREWRRPACAFEIDGAGQAMMHQGAIASPMASPRLSLRGVVVVLRWREANGRRDSRAWCADTLPVAARRQLRLRLATGPAA